MTRVELKELSKQQLEGKRGILAGITFIMFLATIAMNYMIESSQVGITMTMIAGLGSVVISILTLAFYLRFVRSNGVISLENFNIDIKTFLKLLALGFIFMMLTVIVVIISMFSVVMSLVAGSIFGIVIIILLLLIGIFIMSIYLLPLEYMLIENSDLSIFKIIKTSIKIIKGNAWELIKLQFSFIGWYIVGILTLGIGLLWIVPYYMVTVSNFYIHIKDKYEQKDITEEHMQEILNKY